MIYNQQECANVNVRAAASAAADYRDSTAATARKMMNNNRRPLVDCCLLLLLVFPPPCLPRRLCCWQPHLLPLLLLVLVQVIYVVLVVIPLLRWSMIQTGLLCYDWDPFSPDSGMMNRTPCSMIAASNKRSMIIILLGWSGPPPITPCIVLFAAASTKVQPSNAPFIESGKKKLWSTEKHLDM